MSTTNYKIIFYFGVDMIATLCYRNGINKGGYMKYETQIDWRDHNGDIDSDFRAFDTLQEAIEYIETEGNQPYVGAYSRCYINGKKLRTTGVLRVGKVVGDDGEPFCTNQEWHNIFADEKYPRIRERA